MLEVLHHAREARAPYELRNPICNGPEAAPITMAALNTQPTTYSYDADRPFTRE